MTSIIRPLSQKYIDQFPADLPRKSAQAFVATATIGLIYGTAINVSMFGGAVAALATVIETITRPIIGPVFYDSPIAQEVIQTFIPWFIATQLGEMTAPMLGLSFKVSLSILSVIGWNLLNASPFENKKALAFVL
ncbi:MAG: hypothetical protein COT85_07420 [Chlamydiae bacterium CG10_big_fil_rev_8_21_14_0_10_42_34]|nr:MAG: hypothetical protein COT85_07420 [Chlamydiae bacterium CG10_big_fil_rev_8_21_14_0_10_42_34]